MHKNIDTASCSHDHELKANKRSLQEVMVNQDDDGIRLDRWFKRYYKDVSFSVIAKLIRKGQIKINGKKADIATKIKIGETIAFMQFDQITISAKKNADGSNTKKQSQSKWLKPLIESVIYKDEHLLILNKPAKLAVQGGSKLDTSVDQLAEYLAFDGAKPKLVHRLDKETTGILIMARTNQAASAMADLFKMRKIQKTYLAITLGLPKPFHGKIDLPLHKDFDKSSMMEKMLTTSDEESESKAKAQRAVTIYKVIDHAADALSLVEFDLITGRTHQIRAHMAAIGHPLIGDRKYGNRAHLPSFIDKTKLYLHSHTVSFNLFGKDYKFTAEPAAHFKEAMENLGLHS